MRLVDGEVAKGVCEQQESTACDEAEVGLDLTGAPGLVSAAQAGKQRVMHSVATLGPYISRNES